MSIGRYIWVSDIRNNPNSILAYFEGSSRDLGEIKKFTIGITCFDYKEHKEYGIFIMPERMDKSKNGMVSLSTGDNMCLKLGDDKASIPSIVNKIYDILSKKYSCVCEETTVDATDKRRFYKNMSRKSVSLPMIVQ